MSSRIQEKPSVCPGETAVFPAPQLAVQSPSAKGQHPTRLESEADNFGYCGANCATQHVPTVVDVVALPFKKAGESEVNIELIKKTLR